MFDDQQLELLVKIVNAIIPVFLMVGVGAACRAFGVVTEVSERSLMKLVLLVLYPCFILARIPGNEGLTQVGNVGWALGCGAMLTLLGLSVAAVMARILRMQDEKVRGTFCLATAIQNYGFIPIPLLIALFPDASDEALGVLFVHNLGLELVLWTVGIVVISGSTHGALSRLINGPSVSILVGLILNFSGWFTLIPQPVHKVMFDLGNCTIPISLVLVGISLAGVLANETWTIQWQIVLGCLVSRFLIMPVLFLGGAFLISGFESLKLILIVEAAMPAAVFPIVISKHFGGKPAVAVQVCLFTSLASLLLTPLILAFGIWLLL